MPFTTETFASNMKLGKSGQSEKDVPCSMKYILHGVFFATSRELPGYTQEKKCLQAPQLQPCLWLISGRALGQTQLQFV